MTRRHLHGGGLPADPASMLAQPLAVRANVLPTRIVMPAMATKLASEDGQVTDPLLEYYRRRADEGGIGAIVVEHAFVHPQGRLGPNQLSVARDEDVEGLRRLAQTIKGAPPRRPGGYARSARPVALLQLAHAGSAALPADLEDGIVAPSAVVHPGRKRSGNTGIVPQALDTTGIAAVVAAFADAARRAREAGFDGVEVHAAHGYLLDQFFSPVTNHRDDAYGPQSVENRIRIVAEVVAAVREQMGADGIVAVRFGPCDYAPGGAVEHDGPPAARLLAAAGADIIDVSGGIYNFSTHNGRPPGFFRASSALIRQAVEVPVMTAGGVHSPAGAEDLLTSGDCDLVGVGRALMRQPAWANRALAELG